MGFSKTGISGDPKASSENFIESKAFLKWAKERMGKEKWGKYRHFRRNGEAAADKHTTKGGFTLFPFQYCTLLCPAGNVEDRK